MKDGGVSNLPPSLLKKNKKKLPSKISVLASLGLRVQPVLIIPLFKKSCVLLHWGEILIMHDHTIRNTKNNCF